MKKVISIFLAITIFMSVVFCFSIDAFAAKKQLGSTNTYYSFDFDEKILTISGVGPTPNYLPDDSTIPWYDYSDTIKKVIVEEGVTTIGNYLLYSCSANEFVLPSTLTNIGNYAFAEVHNVSDWVIPYGVTSIGANSFCNSAGLRNVILPSTLKTIGQKAFTNCYYIKQITIPASVKLIGIQAFYQCKALESVAFQSMSSNITIGANCFTGCDKLKDISVPKNAVCNTNFYGYYSTKTKYTDVHLNVYKDSNAYNYATVNGFNYSILDSVPVECGVEYYNIYSNEEKQGVHHYTFVPESSERFCFYTTSDLDVKARLEKDGTVLQENDDISNADADACIVFDCVKGQTYDLFISSVNYSGNYTLIALPINIDSFSVDCSSSINASSGKNIDGELVFSFDNSILDNSLFTVNYANGLVHKFKYANSYYDSVQISVESNVKLNCGSNALTVYIGDKASNISVNVEHSYVEATVEPTPDEDGYILHKCINCDDSYKTDFFKTDKQVYTLYGKCVLSEDRFYNHSVDLPYYNAVIKIGNREYPINEDGSWEIRTFYSCDIIFDNQYGDNATIHYAVDPSNPSKEYKDAVALFGYDFNNDGYVNARDYVIYTREKKNALCDGYWQFGENFISTH